jgi:SPP1 family phage portal protein
MGRMPITYVKNNKDMQGDYERLKAAILRRNKLDDLAMLDAETIADNLLVLIGNELAGDTEDEKARTIQKINKTKIIELLGGNDAKYLNKQENFTMISVFGKALEDAIYDLTMVPNFTSEQFAGNPSGVSLRFKLFAFKKLISKKDPAILKLYRRRLKMYSHALSLTDSQKYSVLNIRNIEITINRNWEDNLFELAQIVSALTPTGLFSNEFLVNLLPNADYTVEAARIESESKQSDTLNGESENMQAILRGMYGNGAE